MPLFGFGDISFNSGTRDFSIDNEKNGPLKALESSSFFGSTLRYPLDLGNYDKGHYMVMFIREQIETKNAQNAGIPDDALNKPQGEMASTIGTADPKKLLVSRDLLNKGTAFTNKLISGAGGSVSKIVDTSIGSMTSGLRGNLTQQMNEAASSTSNKLLKNLAGSNSSTNSFLQTTQLTKDAIALYMPDTLMFQQDQSYAPLQLGETKAGQLLGGVRSAVDAYEKNGKNKQSATSAAIKSAVLYGGSQLLKGPTGKVVFTAATGAVVNPMLELIYTAPDFRTFQYDFNFYPRDESEALEVQRIIEKLRYHQAPEFYDETVGFLRPPSAFDIRFYYGGNVNPNIPPMITSVLTNIQINYAPNGFSSYEIPGSLKPSLGGTGMPVAIQMSLTFKEISYLTKKDFNNA